MFYNYYDEFKKNPNMNMYQKVFKWKIIKYRENFMFCIMKLDCEFNFGS